MPSKAPKNAPQPKDHLPKAELDTFTHEPTGVTLPKFSRIKFGTLRKMRKLDEDDVPFFLVEELADEDNLAIIDALEPDQVGDLFKAWQENAGLETGNSSAS